MSGDPVFVGACAGRDASHALDVLEQRLGDAGASLGDVVGLFSLHVEARHIPAVFEACRPRLGDEPPAWTPIPVVGLPERDAEVAFAAVAVVGGERRVVTPDTIAWWRRLPTSAGCRKGDVAVVAGQYGSDADGYVNTPGDHAGQARNALNRVKEIIGLLGGGLDDLTHVLSLHQDPRAIELGLALATSEFFSDDLPVWTAAGVPALYGFGMLGAYQAIASPGLVAATAEAADPAAAWSEVERGLDGAEAVSVLALSKDVRSLDAARAAVPGNPAVTAAAVTGFRELDSMFAFSALARR